MVGVPMLKAERISRSGPKLSDAQTRNFEAIKYTRAQRTERRPDSRRKGPGLERTAGERARWIDRKAEEPRGKGARREEGAVRPPLPIRTIPSGPRFSRAGSISQLTKL